MLLTNDRVLFIWCKSCLCTLMNYTLHDKLYDNAHYSFRYWLNIYPQISLILEWFTVVRCIIWLRYEQHSTLFYLQDKVKWVNVQLWVFTTITPRTERFCSLHKPIYLLKCCFMRCVIWGWNETKCKCWCHKNERNNTELICSFK